LEALDFQPGPPMCNSYYHNDILGLPEHPAHWEVRTLCGRVIAVCEARRQKAEAENGWICTKVRGGCGRRHHYPYMEWTPIPEVQ
jgi:hypothetical protein